MEKVRVTGVAMPGMHIVTIMASIKAELWTALGSGARGSIKISEVSRRWIDVIRVS